MAQSSRPVFQAVAQDVPDDTGHLQTVQGHADSRQFGAEGEGQTLPLEMFRLILHIVPEISSQIHFFPVVFHLSQIQFGKKEQFPYQLPHILSRVDDHFDVMALLFRCIGNPVTQAVCIPLDLGQRCPQIVGNPGDQFLPAPVIALPRFPGRFELDPRRFKSLHGAADLILTADRYGLVQIAPGNIACRSLQFLQRSDDLTAQPA